MQKQRKKNINSISTGLLQGWCQNFITFHSAYLKVLTKSVLLMRPDRVIYVNFFMQILKFKFLKKIIGQKKSLLDVRRHLQAKF